MDILNGKKIILGISGSIAAYKSASLTRLLVRAGAEVQVLMTPRAADFITPLTLSTLSRRPVYRDVSSEAGWNNHVAMGLWADAMVVAPATATTLSKMANALCDNIIVATYLSARCPVYVAPAMDVDMWRHPATRENVRKLEAFGNRLIPVESGELASGLHGAGRMAEPEQIVDLLADHFATDQPLNGKKVLITAGPTQEPLDPVRYIGNHSSGRMGVALAKTAARRGAEVTLILGPSHLDAQAAGLNTLRVQTAREMLEAAKQYWPTADLAILAAAVADYRPSQMANKKIKKNEDTLELRLVKNPDIALELGKHKQEHQLLIGFALETDRAADNAKEKLTKKNFDFIVLNSLQDPGATFGHDTNKISIFYPNRDPQVFDLKAKSAVAEDILNEATALLMKNKSTP